ncbi:MAG: hypothetical protein KDK28_05345 [Maritimibacter sp.]|nr:hypothetical protein [Maritimibacter sp.]
MQITPKLPKLLDRLLGRRPVNRPAVRQPRKPSPEALAKHWAELAMLEMGLEVPPIDLHDVCPVPASALSRNGEFLGYPLNSQIVPPEQTIEFLNICRDQSLWLAVIKGCNHDNPVVSDIYDWILSQPDCDAQVAIWAFMYLGGPHFCGKAVGDKYAEDAQSLLKPLRRIVQREDSGNHFVSGLRHRKQRPIPGWDPETLLEEARRAQRNLEDGQLPLLRIPETLLMAYEKGTEEIVDYVVDETGILVLSKAQTALL